MPQAAGAAIVLAPVLHVVDLEAVRLQKLGRMADMVEFGAGEDVADDRRIFPRPLAKLGVAGLGRPGDRMVQIEPVRAQQLAHRGQVGRVIVPADMLEHADRGDLVEAPVELLERLQFDRHAVLQPLGGDPLAGEVVLGLAQGHAVAGDAIVLGRMNQQGAPAAADVEKALALLEAQLAADHVQLVVLRLVDVVVPAIEIGAGIQHPLVEEEAVEIVRDVVVELDRSLGRAAGAGARAALGRRPRRLPAAPRQRIEGGQGGGDGQPVDLLHRVPRPDVGARRRHVEDRAVLDIDRLGHPEFDRRHDPRAEGEAGDRRRIVQRQDRTIGRADAFTRPQPHGDLWLERGDRLTDDSLESRFPGCHGASCFT